MPRRHDLRAIRTALIWSAAGARDATASQRSGIPVETIRTWRQGGLPRYAQRSLTPWKFCSACGSHRHDFTKLDAGRYAYLLGVYLGDGYLLKTRGSYALRIALDAAYPEIVAEVCSAMQSISGRTPCTRVRVNQPNCVRVDSGWVAWCCVFPQHGPGRKHARRITLEPWQQSVVEVESRAFLRGLIHSDGWRGLNRVRVKGHDYAYPRYQFSNRSDDIRTLFTDACDRLGIAWRPWTRFHISVARRDAVARLDEFVGPKR